MKESEMVNRKLVVTFLVGLALGAVGVIVAQPFLGRNLSEAVRGGKLKTVSGPVTAKRLGEDRLLLTVVTPEGATLATFTKRVDEIDLLVEAGDTLTLSMPEYDPFLRDPDIARVVKPSREPAQGRPATEPGEETEGGRMERDTTPRPIERTGAEADSAGAPDSDRP